MGCYLRRALGRDLVVLRSLLGHGRVHAVDVSAPPHAAIRTFELPPLPDTSFSGTFVRAGLSQAIVDFRALPGSGAVADWFALPHQNWQLGAPFLGAKNLQSGVWAQDI